MLAYKFLCLFIFHTNILYRDALCSEHWAQCSAQHIISMHFIFHSFMSKKRCWNFLFYSLLHAAAVFFTDILFIHIGILFFKWLSHVRRVYMKGSLSSGFVGCWFSVWKKFLLKSWSVDCCCLLWIWRNRVELMKVKK